MTAILTETRERLLRAIAARIGLDRVAEIHFFAPIKQGGVESGVAVIAATHELPVVAEAEPEVETGAEGEGEVEVEPEVESEPKGEEEAEEPNEEPGTVRHVVYTAAYRHTLKGPDRGKWETNIVAEADAPLLTVDVVVRGVQRRVGDEDEPERMTGEEVRAALAALTAKV